MTSVERTFEYVSLPSEEKSDLKLTEKSLKKSLTPPKDWPQSGEILFDNVSFSYDKNLPNVLSSLSFKINAGEKIGIVGRTGAGKSSIIQTLFRMAEPDGTLLIDNVNIKEISLYNLRNKIAIIPVNSISMIVYIYFV